MLILGWLKRPERSVSPGHFDCPCNQMDSSIKMPKFKIIKQIMKQHTVTFACTNTISLSCSLMLLSIPTYGSFPYGQPSPRLKWSPRALGSAERSEMMDYRSGHRVPAPRYTPVCILLPPSIVVFSDAICHLSYAIKIVSSRHPRPPAFRWFFMA